MFYLKLLIPALITLFIFTDDINDILMQFETRMANEVSIFETDFILASPLHFIPIDRDRYIVIDGINAILTNENGKELSRFGRSGRGPGEFTVINDVFIGQQGYIFVYDSQQMRITTLKIEDDNFIYEKNYIINSFKENYRLRKIYPAASGYYGVFKNLFKDYYIVVSLNEQFEHKDELLAFSTNDFPEVAAHTYTEQITYTFHNGKFYYSDKYTLSVFECIIEEAFCKNIFDGIGFRKVTDDIINYFEEELRQYPVYDLLNQLKNNNIIDWVNLMIADNNYLYFPIASYSDMKPTILKINLTNADVKAITIPVEIGQNLHLIHLNQDFMVFNLRDGAYFDSLVKVSY